MCIVDSSMDLARQECKMGLIIEFPWQHPIVLLTDMCRPTTIQMERIVASQWQQCLCGTGHNVTLIVHCPACISLTKQQSVLTHTIRQTHEIPASLDSWAANATSVQKVCPQTELFSLYFCIKMMCLSWSLRTCHVLSPLQLSIAGPSGRDV